MLLDNETFERNLLASQVRERPFAWLGRFARKVQTVPDAEFCDLVEDAEAQGHLTEEEAEEITQIGAVVRGQHKIDGAPLYLAVETSDVIDRDSLNRALQRAKLLQKASKIMVMAVVVGNQIQPDMCETAERSRVGWMLRRP